MRITHQYFNDKNHTIKYEAFETSMVHNIPLFVKDERVGRALVIEPVDTEWYIIMDITADETGKGYGSELMDFMRGMFPNMLTLAKNKRVRNFLLKNGFVEHVSVHKHKPNYYTYEKDKNNIDLPKWVENGSE